MTDVSETHPIAQRITHIRQALPPSVRLIAVSKNVSVAAMRMAYAVGIRDFGESRIQEAEEKQIQLKDLTEITWHFIGHLQSNKVQKTINQFQWIHSVDSLKLAQRLDRLAESLSQPPKICLQVKLLPDPSKHGWTVSELLDDLAALDQLTQIQIWGLMIIPPAGLSETETLAVFQQAQALAEQIRSQPWQHLNIQELSMGMSGDYLLAIQAGATMIRLGTLLFGDRPPP
jgi:PLP dependent protein